MPGLEQLELSPEPSLTDVMQVLTAASELLADPAKWTKGTSARNSVGKSVACTDSRAVCFCSLGAIELAARTHVQTQYMVSKLPEDDRHARHLNNLVELTVKQMEKAVVGNDVPVFNDLPATTHPQVMNAFRMALARTKFDIDLKERIYK
jgi:hypothetical protein